jgi:hypothetical protein
MAPLSDSSEEIVQGSSTTSGNDVFTSEEQPPPIYSSTVGAQWYSWYCRGKRRRCVPREKKRTRTGFDH